MNANIKWVGCAPGNFGPGRLGGKPEAIVLHLMDGSLNGTDNWFRTPPEKRGAGALASSAHYGVGKSGEIHQYVRDEDRAYHAGRIHTPKWPYLLKRAGINPNNYTLGIEHEGLSYEAWTDTMCKSSAVLIRGLCDKWSIPLDRLHICGHREIFIDKLCPGPQCDIDRLISMAMGVVV